jgi:hypothetical protein
MILSLAVAGDLKLWEEVEKRADQESIFRRQRRLNSLKKPFRHDGSSPEAQQEERSSLRMHSYRVVWQWRSLRVNFGWNIQRH